ncbi:Armadillo/beta-catenin-like repeat family protein [Acanthocheilonema viteae]
MEIMTVVQTTTPSVRTIQLSLHLLNIFLDIQKLPVMEMFWEGLDMILTEGMQFKNAMIQYHATHAMLEFVKYMTERQLQFLIPRGLKDGIKAVLHRDLFFIIQEGIELCSQIAIKSPSLRDDVANWGSLRLTELLAKHHNRISLELTHSVTSLLQSMCYHKLIPEFVLKRLANSSCFLLQHEDEGIRATVLNIVIEIARNKDVVVTFEHNYVNSIFQFLDSTIEFEAASAFFIVGYFVKQHNSNTIAILQMGFIEKIVPFLTCHSAQEIVLEACSILQNLLSKKKYIKYVGSMVESGIVLMLLKLLNDDSPIYKNEACTTLYMLNGMWKPKYVFKMADEKHIRIMCDILKSSNSKHVACCVVVLMHSTLNACSILKADFELIRATDLIRELEADECIAEFVNNTQEGSSINNLASELYTLYLNDVEVDSDEDNYAETEEALPTYNSGFMETEICASQIVDDSQTMISYPTDCIYCFLSKQIGSVHEKSGD